MKTDKKYIIELEDGRVFAIEAHKIADNRSKHYADEDPDSTYQDEYQFLLDNDFQMGDWLFNNMNWYELDPVLVRKQRPDLSAAVVVEHYMEK